MVLKVTGYKTRSKYVYGSGTKFYSTNLHIEKKEEKKPNKLKPVRPSSASITSLFRLQVALNKL